MANEQITESKNRFTLLEVLIAGVQRVASGRDRSGNGMFYASLALHLKPELIKDLRAHLMVKNKDMARLVGMQATDLSAMANGNRYLSHPRAEAIIRAAAKEMGGKVN